MRHAVALGLLLLTAPAGAATIVLDFEEEALGDRGPSFLSAECGCVTLSVLYGNTDLHVVAAPDNVLQVGVEGGTLVLDFAAPVSSLAITFGDAGATAIDWHDPVLTGYFGGLVVASATVAPNMNGLIDQTLSISGTIDRAVFEFVQLGENAAESPIVGTISFVPEPAASLLLAIAVVAVARRAAG